MAWRRNWRGSEIFYFLMYLCRLMFQTNVSGFLIRQMGILLLVFIRCSLVRKLTSLIWFWMVFGINKVH